MKFMGRTGVFVCVAWLLAGFSSAYSADNEKLKSSVKIQGSVEKSAISSQKKINKISDETERMLTEYKLILRQYDALHGYNNQVQKIVSGQQKELDSMDLQPENC